MPENDVFNEKIQSILSNPESLKSILQIASSIGLNNKVESKEEEKTSALPVVANNENNNNSSLGTLNNKSILQGDERVNLLLSIKPFLNDKKRQKIDGLIKALQAAKLINTYKDLDLFSNFGIK